MRRIGLFAALFAVVAMVGAIGSSQPAFAAVHCMRVYSVMAGYNGDTNVQYVELRMSLGDQPFTSGSQIRFYGANGMLTDTTPLNANMPVGQGGTGTSILIGTAQFDALGPAGNPASASVDFLMTPVKINAPSGKVKFGAETAGNCSGEPRGYDSVAYGSGYTGTVEYEPAPATNQHFATDLPTSGSQAIQLKAGWTSNQGTNAADYELVSNPQPCKYTPSANPDICGGLNPANDPDGDGVCDSAPPGPCSGTDLCPNTAAGPVDSNGCSDAQADPDGDGWCSPGVPVPGGPTPACTMGPDNCPAVANPGQSNADGDAFGNACDTEGPNPNTNGVGGGNDCADSVDNDADGSIDMLDPGCDPGDSDGDGVPNVVDNCDDVPNPGQANFDATQTWGGDSMGNACDPDDDDDGFSDDIEAGTPVCADLVNDDDFDDGMFNDGCPAIGTAESVCTGSSDEDGDTRVNDGCTQAGTLAEGGFNVGTGTVNPCHPGAAPNTSPSWPADFVSGSIPDSTDKVNILDLTGGFLAPTRTLDTSPGDLDFSSRVDISPGRGLFPEWINISDLTTLLAGTSGFPPMFLGARAFDGPSCTGP